MGCVPLPLLYTNFRPNEMPMRRRVTEAAEALTFISRLGAFTNSRWYEPVQRGVVFCFFVVASHPRCASVPSQTTSRIRESQESGSCAKEGRSHGKPKDAGKPDRSSASPIINTANGSARLIRHQMNDARQAFLELRQQSSFSTQDTGNTDAPPASDFPSTMV